MGDVGNRIVRVGFIGAGFIAQVTHLPAFAEESQAMVAAIADPRPALRAAVSHRFSAVPMAHHDEILGDPAIDAVVICVHRRCLAGLVRAAVAARKHVLSEKPMAYSSTEGAALASAADEADVRYAVGFMKRLDPGVLAFRQKLRNVLDSGELGEMVHVAVRDFCPTYGVVIPFHLRAAEGSLYRYETSAPGPDGLPSEYESDYDYSLNVLVHDLNLLRFLFGDVFEAAHFTVRAGRSQVAHLSTPSFDASILVGRSDGGTWDQEIEILFRHGRMRLVLPSPLDRQRVARCDIRDSRDRVFTLRADDEVWAFRAQAGHFVRACLDELPLASTGQDAVADLRLIERLWARVSWNR